MVRNPSLALALGALTLAASAAHAADRPPVVIYTPVAPANGVIPLTAPGQAADVTKRFTIVIQRKDAADYPIRIARANVALFPIRVIQPGTPADGGTPPAPQVQPALRVPLALTRPTR